MFRGHFYGFERHSRLFEKGDLKYVILDLLKDKPAHGYEIIRALEEAFPRFLFSQCRQCLSDSAIAGGHGLCEILRAGWEKDLYHH